METFTAALVQIEGTADPEENLRRLERGVREAAGRGARLVCGPEYVYFSGDVRALGRLATPVPGPLTDRFASIARAHGVHFSPGTIPECGRGGRPYNTFLLFGPDGSLIGAYRKRHLFRADIPGVLTADERDDISPGDAPAPVFRTALGGIGVGICYDLRFPEQFLRLALDGAEILLLPSAVTKPTGEAHWRLLCRARAVETGCFLLGPNRTGRCGPDTERYGHSIIVDPWGGVLAEAGEGEEVVFAELRAAALGEARGRMRSIEHRAAGDSVPDPAA
ncbi:MAG: carbon-nitrogen hydrolase family protein [bacterium]|nr:carbon-nitrogen hydrolase family protein [bacterium]